MDIQATGLPLVLSAKSHSSAPERARRSDAVQAKPAPQEPSAVPVDDAVAASTQDGDSSDTRAQGVLRLLESGHFRGVADVRLRINFFDELSAKATADAQQAAQAGAANLVSGVNDNLAGLTEALGANPDAGASLGDLTKAFQDGVQNSLDAFLGTQTPDSAALADSLQSAFTTLVDGLRAALTPQDSVAIPVDSAPAQSAEVPVDATSAGTSEADPGAASVDAGAAASDPAPVVPLPETQDPAPSDTPAFDLAGALTSLKTVFDNLLGSMMDSVSNRAMLPDPSSPSGNGKAYDKFLEAYNDLRGVQQNQVLPATDPLEIVG